MEFGVKLMLENETAYKATEKPKIRFNKHRHNALKRSLKNGLIAKQPPNLRKNCILFFICLIKLQKDLRNKQREEKHERSYS